MNEVELQQILEVLLGLFDSGRLTLEDGKLKVDGILVMDPEAANEVDETPTGYDEHGISHAVSVHGGVRLKAVDERLALDRESNDSLVKKVATAFPQWFFINVDRGQSEEERWVRDCNYNKWTFYSGWFKAYINWAYNWADAKWIHRVTGALLKFQYVLSREQHYSGEWGKTEDWYKTQGKLPNHLTYSMGVSSSSSHPNYEKKYLAQAEKHALAYYEKQIAAARYAASLATGTPQVGPGRG